MKNICILGCGYVGSDAASYFSKNGYHVTATTRHSNRLEELSKIAQKSVIFKGVSDEELIGLISANETILISIAPDSIEEYPNAYLDIANMFRSIALDLNKPVDLIYIGSTAVYGDHHGLWVDESSELLGATEQAKILIETEKTYLSLQEVGWSVSILRCGEIYGPGRELSKKVKQLEGHFMPGSGENYTNMVQKEDIVGAIGYIVRHGLDGIYNLVDDEHPLRKELYEEVAKKNRLPLVQWNPEQRGQRRDNKRVSNHKIKSAGYILRYPRRVLS